MLVSEKTPDEGALASTMPARNGFNSVHSNNMLNRGYAYTATVMASAVEGRAISQLGGESWLGQLESGASECRERSASKEPV